MFCTFTFDRGLRFWSGLLVLKFTAAVGAFTWAYFACFLMFFADENPEDSDKSSTLRFSWFWSSTHARISSLCHLSVHDTTFCGRRDFRGRGQGSPSVQPGSVCVRKQVVTTLRWRKTSKLQHAITLHRKTNSNTMSNPFFTLNQQFEGLACGLGHWFWFPKRVFLRFLLAEPGLCSHFEQDWGCFNGCSAGLSEASADFGSFWFHWRHRDEGIPWREKCWSPS